MGRGQRGVNLDRVVREALHKVMAVNLNEDKKHVKEQKEWCPRQREQQVQRLGGLEDGCTELWLIMMPLSNNVFLFIVFIKANSLLSQYGGHSQICSPSMSVSVHFLSPTPYLSGAYEGWKRHVTFGQELLLTDVARSRALSL